MSYSRSGVSFLVVALSRGRLCAFCSGVFCWSLDSHFAVCILVEPRLRVLRVVLCASYAFEKERSASF